MPNVTFESLSRGRYRVWVDGRRKPGKAGIVKQAAVARTRNQLCGIPGRKPPPPLAYSPTPVPVRNPWRGYGRRLDDYF